MRVKGSSALAECLNQEIEMTDQTIVNLLNLLNRLANDQEATANNDKVRMTGLARQWSRGHAHGLRRAAQLLKDAQVSPHYFQN